MAEAGAPRTTEANVIAARPPAQEVEMKAAEASVAPLVQGPPSLQESAREAEVHPISSDDTSQALEVVDAEVADAVEQPERDVWDQLQRQKGLLTGANELLSARSAKVEDLRLHCADAKVEAAAAQEQVTPLAVQVKELEEELTHVVEIEGEASRAAEASRVEAQRLKEKAEASRVEAQRWKEKVEASQVEAQCWEQKAEELEKVTRAAEASVMVQAVLETKIGEHDALKSVARTVDQEIVFPKTGGSGLQLTVFSDADMAGDIDGRRRTSGVLVILDSAPISWLSLKQKVVALSTCEAEDCVDGGQIVIEFVETGRQLADVLTKLLGRLQFTELKKMIGVVEVLGLAAGLEKEL
ncbi:uncharacterized protein [Miscanthus floridulus]|uniref:uncharacterized protein n=1 Tax=Miscanthus floridulus TaxID=154761 RepID=UPI00345ABEC9